MSTLPVRYCHPCKAEGVRTQTTERARVAGKITNVCAHHRAALTVVRATVSGSGTVTRQETEGAIFTDADTLASQADTLADCQRKAWAMIDASAYARIVKASRYSQGTTTIANDVMRDARYDDILDAVVSRIGDRLFRGDAVDVARIVEVACFSNTSARSRQQDAPLDLPIMGAGGEGSASGHFVGAGTGNTLGDLFESRGMLPTVDAVDAEEVGTMYRVAGRTLTAEDVADLVAAYPAEARKAGIFA